MLGAGNLMNDQDLLCLIKDEYYRIKPTGCWDFFKKRDKKISCLQNLSKRFDMTFNEILILAGIPDEELNFVRRTPEQYLHKLKDIILELGYVPSAKEFSKLGYSPKILAKYFGSYNKAMELLGYSAISRKTPIKVNETDDELLSKYINYSKKIGKPASYNDLNNNSETHDAAIYNIRFGGMTSLKKAVGFEPCNTYSNKFTKKEIKDKLKELFAEKGRKLTVQELVECKEVPSYTTILKYFETTSIHQVWDEVLSDFSFVNDKIA